MDITVVASLLAPDRSDDELLAEDMTRQRMEAHARGETFTWS